MNPPADATVSTARTSASAESAKRSWSSSSSPGSGRDCTIDVDPGHGALEHAAERLVERVGQDIGGADEAHPEQHREAGEGEAELAGEHALHRRPEHSHWLRHANAGTHSTGRDAREACPATKLDLLGVWGGEHTVTRSRNAASETLGRRSR